MKTFVSTIASCLLLLIFAVGVSHRHVYAQGEFQEDYDVQYSIAPSGTTIVTQKVSLTNKQTNLYPQKYSIIIDSKNIKNVIAYDNKGIIQAQISQNDGRTQIVLPFNDKVAGLGKVLTFSLRYENTDIAQKNGSIWEVNIPGVADNPDLASYIVSLSVPPTFGANAYMTPLPALGNRWNKEQMVRGGISAAYGTAQYFDLTISYFIENPTVTSKRMEIALPPDTAFQKVFIRSIDPKPKTVTVDNDGNWMAQYELTAGQKLSVRAVVTISVLLRPPDGVTENLLDPSIYTKQVKYWETQNPEISALAKKYTTPREIYNYVVSTLAYDYARVNENSIRKGAAAALVTPKNAICMEFTDLFIAIARAAGVPARENVGYAYTTNARLRPISVSTDILHAWPEYYDKERRIWVPVDPTWANTTGGVNYFDKLDFNHITFAKYGEESDYPYPAGFYKKSGSTGKDIAIEFSDTKPAEAAVAFRITYDFPKTASAGFPATGTVHVENITGNSVPSATVSIQSTPFDVSIVKNLTTIPPYGAVSIPVEIELPGYFMNGNGMIVTTVEDTTARYDFEIQPLWHKFTVPIISFGFVLIVITVTALRKSSLWKLRKR